MNLCAPPDPCFSQEKLQAQHRKNMMPRILPQFNERFRTAATEKAKYLVLDGSSALAHEEAGDDDLESNKLRRNPQQQANKSQSSQRFFPHADRRNRQLTGEAREEGKIDIDQPLNLTTISLLSPVEQDILERRVHAMATHGIGFVVTKKGVDIRPADYFPTEEEGVLNEGFMSVDDSSHHSKYDRESAVTSPLSLSVHNPAAANLPRLQKKSVTQAKPSPDKRFDLRLRIPFSLDLS